MTETRSISLDFYRLDDIADIVDNAQELTLDGEVQECIGRGADYIASIAGEDRHIYGINTGFGSLCVRRIEEHEQSELQHRHLLSHACGVGEPMPARISRITTVIKLLTFRSGYCGITPNTVNRMLDFWGRGIVPAIPKKGTVGASGDLAPLAHLALPLIGEGKAPRTTAMSKCFSLPTLAAARSRAMPATPSQSGRFGVTSKSMTGSAPNRPATGVPTGISGGSS